MVHTSDILNANTPTSFCKKRGKKYYTVWWEKDEPWFLNVCVSDKANIGKQPTYWIIRSDIDNFVAMLNNLGMELMSFTRPQRLAVIS